MPTYEYECDACHHAFEQFQRMTDPAVRKCPKCAKLKVRRLISGGAGVIFKGAGFYETDYKRSRGAGAKRGDAAGADGGAKAGGEGATSSGSEPKSSGGDAKKPSSEKSSPSGSSSDKSASKPDAAKKKDG